jgi:hypothetical protein
LRVPAANSISLSPSSTTAGITSSAGLARAEARGASDRQANAVAAAMDAACFMFLSLLWSGIGKAARR